MDAPTIRVFVCFEGSCEAFDVSPYQTVQAMKQMVKKHFLVHLPDEKHSWHFLELIYCGATLQDSWALCDVGITGGSTIRGLIKSEQRPVMHVFNTVTGETLPVTEGKALLHMPVARLKTVVSKLSSLPVSTFRLSSSTGVKLYDCNQIQDYGIEVGTTLRLESWDGWLELLQGCLLGCRLTVQSHLSKEKTVLRFQLRVALYIAASLGHLELADWLIRRGERPEERVGVHPYRQWCYQSAHRDTGKCPIHIAAENGQLLVLKLFVAKNILSLACRDPGGCDPLKIAIRHGHKNCVRYLANKLCSVVSLPTMSLPMRLYLQLKRWASLGQKRVITLTNQWQGSTALLQTRVLLVDGFNQSKMSSKSIRAETKHRGVKGKAQHPLPAISSSPQLNLRPVARGGFRDIHKRHKQDVKCNEVRLDKIKEVDNKSKLILPPIYAETHPREMLASTLWRSYNTLNASLESSFYFGQATRQNAIHCLSIASTFTGKPWSKQLSIARTLIRKHVHCRA